MSKINERCAGIDVGKRFLLCCVLTAAANEEPSPRNLRFDTTVAALIRLREWLVTERITHVVMESTGSYWIPHIQHSRGSLCRCAGESRGSQEPQRP